MHSDNPPTAGHTNPLAIKNTGLWDRLCLQNIALTNGQTYFITIWAGSVAGYWSTASSANTTINGKYTAPLLGAGGVTGTTRTSTNFQLIDTTGEFVVFDIVVFSRQQRCIQRGARHHP